VTDSIFELGKRVFRIAEEVEGGVAKAPRPVQVVYAVMDFYMEATLGGVTGWLLHRDDAWHIRSLVSAYQELGSESCATRARLILSFLPDRGLPDDVDERSRIVFRGMPPECDDVWSRIADELLAWPDGLSEKVMAYVAAHPDAFARA
jgi:hypothetical protein